MYSAIWTGMGSMSGGPRLGWICVCLLSSCSGYGWEVRVTLGASSGLSGLAGLLACLKPPVGCGPQPVLLKVWGGEGGANQMNGALWASDGAGIRRMYAKRVPSTDADRGVCAGRMACLGSCLLARGYIILGVGQRQETTGRAPGASQDPRALVDPRCAASFLQGFPAPWPCRRK